MSTRKPPKTSLECYCKANHREYLLSEWDYEKNYPLTPEDVSYGCSDKAWWVCSKGHSYESYITNRARRGDNCPFCSNKAVLAGYNDLETFCKTNCKEILLSEWDYEKNYPATPQNVLYGSFSKRWWKCPKGHSYESVVHNRASKNFQCPYCSSQKLLKGFNDLQTRRPEILRFWDSEKNTDFSPSEVMAFSNKYADWKCPDCGYEWKASICNTRSCPRCTCNYKVSESEHIIFYYLSKFLPIERRDRLHAQNVIATLHIGSFQD